MLALFTKKPTLTTISLKGMKQHWHYEVLTNEVMDVEGKSYLSIDHAIKVLGQNPKLMVNEDLIVNDMGNVYRYEFNDDDRVNQDVARKLNFGVIRIIKGKLESKEYMFPLYMDEQDYSIEMFAYGVLAHGYADKRVVKKMESDNHFNEHVRLVLGKSYYEVLNKLDEIK